MENQYMVYYTEYESLYVVFRHIYTHNRNVMGFLGRLSNIMNSNKLSHKLEGLSEKIFLDRYAWKDADPNHAKVGDVVLVLTKDDPKFPTKEVGEIVERQGQTVKVKTRSGETIQTEVEKLTLNIEKHRRRCGTGSRERWLL